MFSRKTKIVSLMTLGFLIFAFGVVFGLQKLGVVNIKGLADIIPLSATYKASINITGENFPSGSAIVILDQSTGSQVAERPVSIYGNYDFYLPAGSYIADTSKCVAFINFSVNANTTNQTTGGVMSNCTPSSSGGGGGTVEPHNLTVYLTVKTDCTTCSNIDSHQRINGIPVNIVGVGQKSTDNSLQSDGANFKYDNVRTGTYIFEINKAGSSGYNPDYETLLKSENINSSTATWFDIVTLRKSSTGGSTTPTTFDLEGLIRFENGSYPPTTNYVSAVCPSTPTAERTACYEKLTNGYKSVWFLAQPADPNFKITDLYNIAQSGATFSSYAIWVRGAPGMYLDLNNDGQVQDNEKATGNADSPYYIFTINASDIHPADANHPKAWARKNYTLKSIPSPVTEPSKFRVEGMIAYGSNPIPGVEIGIAENLQYPALDFTISSPELINQETNFRIGNINLNNNSTYTADVSLPENFSFSYNNFDLSQRIKKINFTKSDLELSQDGSIFVKRIMLQAYPLNCLQVKVVDNQTSETLSDATVYLVSTIPAVTTQQVTNQNGRVYVFGSNIEQFIFQSNFSKNAQLSVSKEGYLTKVVNFADRLANYTNRCANFFEVRLDPAEGRRSMIVGEVSEINSHEKIAGVTVNMWKENTSDDPVSTTTDANGQFKLNTSGQGNYIIKAFKLGYEETSQTIDYLTLSADEAVESNLYLEERKDEGRLLMLPIIVMNGLNPVNNADVLVENNFFGVQQSAKTQLGFAFIPIKIGEPIKITVRFNIDGVEQKQEREISISNSYYDLPKSVQENEREKALFVFGKESLSIASLTINIFNQDNQAIEGAELTRRVPGYQDGTEYELTATSNGQGKIVLPDFFNQQTNSYSSFGDDLDSRLYAGENFEFLISKTSYKTFSGNLVLKEGANSLDIVLEQEAKDDSARILVDVIDPVSQQVTYAGRKEYLLSNLVLEKKPANQSVYTRLDLKPEYTGNSYAFVPTEEGTYHACLKDKNVCSSSVDFNKIITVELRLVVCGMTGGVSLEKYSDNVYMVLPEFIKEDYGPQVNAILGEVDELSKRAPIGPGSSIVINFVWSSVPNAYHYNVDIDQCFSLNAEKTVSLTFLSGLLEIGKINSANDLMSSIAAHEYGHGFYRYIEKHSTDFYIDWVDLYNQLSDSNFGSCVWSSIKDGNTANAPALFGGHPQDSPTEMFASFFSAYYTNHNYLYGIIKYHTEASSNCQNSLIYAWQLFSEQAGKVYSNDDTFFNPISSAKTLSYLSFDQISSGIWLKENYDKLSLMEKSNLQIDIAYASARNLVASSYNIIVSVTKTALQAINNGLEAVLSALGITYNNSSVAGIVTDQNSLTEKILVNIGNKFDLTDENGQFSISRLPSGDSQSVELYDSTIDRTYRLPNISLGDSEHKTGVNLQIIRSLYMFSGQVFDDYVRLSTSSYYPVANGSIVLDGTTVIPLDSQGKFSQAITEGVHSVVVKNKGGTTLDIVDSGSLRDLSNLVVKSDLTSDIRVKNVDIVYPADCIPNKPETKTIACPSGQTGSITQTRTSSCPGPTSSDWQETANNCVAVVSKLPSDNTFGTSSSWWTFGSSYDKAWDGNTSTYFNGNKSSGGYTGVNLGSGTKKIVTKVKYYPRDRFASRMKGGKFQGSNTSQTTGYVDLYTISDTPAQGQYAEANLNNTKVYRYIRYLSPSGGYTNVAEIELWGIDTASAVNPPQDTCTPFPSETRTQSCPTGQEGLITQARSSSCPGPSWSDWITVSNTCKTPPSSCTPLPKETQTVACPSGQTGSITQTRTSSCPGPNWSSWQDTSNTCKKCSWLQKLFGMCK